MSTAVFSSCQLLYATQSGRAKACARRVERTLRSHCPRLTLSAPPLSLDEAWGEHLCLHTSSLQGNPLIIFFISTTGDGEPPDTMRQTWKQMLQKSLPRDSLQSVSFCVFNLGDRAYGPQFCAAGRKFAVRCLQLGAKIYGEPGYGDDGTTGGGCLRDLDQWIETQLKPVLQTNGHWQDDSSSSPLTLVVPYHISTCTTTEDEESFSLEHLNAFFRRRAPLTAYSYTTPTNHDERDATENGHPLPLHATIQLNKRLTPNDWEQDTRHIQVQLPWKRDKIDKTDTAKASPLSPYQAGDVVSILPVNSKQKVDHFLSVLPTDMQGKEHEWIDIRYDNPNPHALVVGVGYHAWPDRVTLRQWLTYCADIAALPEREDLWALGHYCSPTAHNGKDQREKLQALSDTTASALYTDYILRQKRSWADVFYDFDSLRAPGSLLTLEALVSLLAPIRPREFSIASAPSSAVVEGSHSVLVELTVAVVEGTTPLGRSYQGLCSNYLAKCCEGDTVRLWIRPGSFGNLPRQPAVPVLFMGAGTGIAPLRGLIHERLFYHTTNEKEETSEALQVATTSSSTSSDGSSHQWTTSNVLLFGCRKASTDFYYQDEWHNMVQDGPLTLLTAFSRDQKHKFYVQQRLRQQDPQGEKLLHHLAVAGGHLYIAGGAKMAKSIKEEIIELLDPHLGGKATQFLSKLQRAGRFRVEAWS